MNKNSLNGTKNLSKETVLEKLNAKTRIDPITNCWIWEGSNNGTHGEIRITSADHGYKRKFYVHRLSAWIHLEMLLESTEYVCHKNICSTSLCWNPEHIYRGNQSTNMYDHYEGHVSKPDSIRRKFDVIYE